MRTTLTLDDDVAAKLDAEARRTGRSFKDTVNYLLRLGLSTRNELEKPKRFRVRARALELRPGVDVDNVAELLEQLEGAAHR